ncbi:MAG: WD40/YVTN/BNR-like repeat-containing protein, partial [Deferrisomatales bacterium]
MRRRVLGLCLAAALAGGAAPGWARGPYGGTVAGLSLAADGATPAWAASARGLFRRAGGAWQRVEALGQRELVGLVESGERLVVASARGEVLTSDDRGATWHPATQGLVGRYGHPVRDVLCLAVDPADPRRLYLGAAAQGPFESRDGGRSWRLLFEGLEAEAPPALFPTVLLPAAGDRPLLMGTGGRGLFARVEGRWVARGGGLPADLRVQALASAPGDPAHLALGSNGRGLWESRDGGATWKLLRQGAVGVAAAVSVAEDGAVLAHIVDEGLA